VSGTAREVEGRLFGTHCQITRAADKGQILCEAYRVLKSGGRFAVSDVAAQGKLPEDLRSDMEA
jgi:ubiquinone/menaquinone biosynthesis C-methylase UbiE